MVFVTVGTHEQPFNRLVQYMDNWAGEHEEKVVIQTGFSTYEPINCEWSKLLPYSQMTENVEKARIVITHGGPSSFIMALQVNKIPIVVPRKKEYGEHVNDHQVAFSHAVSERQGNIILVEDVEQLGKVIENYDERIRSLKNVISSNNEKFCAQLEEAVYNLLGRGD